MEKNIAPCDCGNSRWKTLEKGKRYQCRIWYTDKGKKKVGCGKIRNFKDN